MGIVAVLSAIAYILMFMEFSVPIMPGFIKMDLSDLPALIGTFAVGPAGGVLIALIKNLLHLTVTSTAGVGELSNFILNAVFILPAGILYRRRKTRKSACLGAVLGAALMAVVSVANLFTNQMYLFSFYGASAERQLYTIGYYLFLNTQQAGSSGLGEYPYLAAFGIVVSAVTIPLTVAFRKMLNKIGKRFE